jgi:hemerythrin-like domain-containing protein
MEFSRQISRALYREHCATLDLLGRLEPALLGAPRAPGLVALLATLERHLALEVGRHFDFEERELFVRMKDTADSDLAVLLAEEHVPLRAVASELAPLLRSARDGTLDDAGWSALKRLGLELVERLTAHIHKEDSALLPLAEDLFDDETDRELAFSYAAQ